MYYKNLSQIERHQIHSLMKANHWATRGIADINLSEQRFQELYKLL